MQGNKDYSSINNKSNDGKKTEKYFYLFHYISLSHYKIINNAEILYK